MAALPPARRRVVWADVMSYLSRHEIRTSGFGKAPLRTAIDNLDARFDTDEASLPGPLQPRGNPRRAGDDEARRAARLMLLDDASLRSEFPPALRNDSALPLKGRAYIYWRLLDERYDFAEGR